MPAMKKLSKLLYITLFFAVLAFCAAGCGSPSEETTGAKRNAGKKPLIGVLLYTQDDTYLGIVADVIRKNLEGKADVEIFHAEGDQMAQNEQIEALLRKKVDALALNIVDPLAIGRVVDSIRRADVPVVLFNREPDLGAIKNYGKACFVGTAIFDAGSMQGDIIKELRDSHPEFDRNGDGKCQYIMIQANIDNPEAVVRTEYSVKQARANGLVMQQVGETLLCNWNETLAHETMRLVFPLHENTVELIISNNDSMALGAIKAMNESGYNLEGGDAAKFIPVVGVDAIPAAVEAIRKGVMSATVVQDGDAMGKAVANMAMNAATGKDFLEGVPHPWDATGIAIRIPYSRFSHK